MEHDPCVDIFWSSPQPLSIPNVFEIRPNRGQMVLKHLKQHNGSPFRETWHQPLTDATHTLELVSFECIPRRKELAESEIFANGMSHCICNQPPEKVDVHAENPSRRKKLHDLAPQCSFRSPHSWAPPPHFFYRHCHCPLGVSENGKYCQVARKNSGKWWWIIRFISIIFSDKPNLRQQLYTPLTAFDTAPAVSFVAPEHRPSSDFWKFGIQRGPSTIKCSVKSQRQSHAYIHPKAWSIDASRKKKNNTLDWFQDHSTLFSRTVPWTMTCVDQKEPGWICLKMRSLNSVSNHQFHTKKMPWIGVYTINCWHIQTPYNILLVDYRDPILSLLYPN